MTTRMIIALALLVGCQGKEQCKSWSSGGPSASWGSCGDKSERAVDCQPVMTTSAVVGMKCTCTVDKVIVKSFETTDTPNFATLESSTKIANEACGWHLSR